MTRLLITTITLLLPLSVLAGSMTPPQGGPAAGSGMPTTRAIFQQLSSGQVPAAPSEFQGPVSGPVVTGRSLKEISGKLPTPDNINGATSAEVMVGKIFWGLRTDGTWGTMSGAMPDNGAVLVTPTTTQQPIAAGFHNGSGKVIGDANLLAANIKAGTTIFGVSGLATLTSCSDSLKNYQESDIDCGGSGCPRCGIGKTCNSGPDCTSGVCTGGTCSVAVCGDGIVGSGEACDDGNTVNGDGCSSTCSIESGWGCGGNPSICAPNICGRGSVTPGGIASVPPGMLDNPGSPSAGSGMPSLQGIYDQLASGAAASSLSGPFSGPAAGPAQTMKSLKQISDIAPMANPAGAVPGDVRSAKSYWGLKTGSGLWGLQSGTMPDNCAVILTPTTTDQTIAAGYHNGAGKVIGDANLAAANIKAGKSIFGVSGLFCSSGAECASGICTANVCIPSVCGNGIKEGDEQCDDGNTVNGDGCSSTCQIEATAETETNNTCATANGPYTIQAGSFGTVLKGSLSPSTDQDWFSFTTTAYADLSFQTFDQTSLGTCASPLDTVIQLYKSDCTTTQSTSQDQGGIGNCSKLDSTTQAAAMKHVPPGTYVLKVTPYSTSLGNYFLQAKYTALCGNGVIEGSEQCDGGANCGTDCMLLAVCGDGIVQSGEPCDDGNTANGDGCSSMCQWETIAEVEPNDTTAAADTNATNNPQLLINGNRNITGGISAATDKDIFKVSVAQNNTVLHFETFDSSGTDCRTAAPYNMSGHALRLLNSAGTAIVTDYESSSATGYGSSNTYQAGIGVCAALSYRVDAGVYYIQVDKTAALASYHLQVRFHTDLGSEVEPNDLYTTATPAPGRTFQILGDHMTATDTDYYAVTVPAGMSIRAEIIEGDSSESCESNGIDSTLYLYNSAGTSLGSDSSSDTGRGYCSRIDGTGSTPLNSFAHALTAGTYYLKVASYSTTATAANQFKYRLIVSVR